MTESVSVIVEVSTDRINSVEVKDSVIETVDISVIVTGVGVIITVSVDFNVSVSVTVVGGIDSVMVDMMTLAGRVTEIISVLISVAVKRRVSVEYSVKVIGATETECVSTEVICSTVVIVSVSVLVIVIGSSVMVTVGVLVVDVVEVVDNLEDDCCLVLWKFPKLLRMLKKLEKIFCALFSTKRAAITTSKNKSFILWSNLSTSTQ